MRETSDADLLREFVDGSAAAFSEFYHRHGAKLYGYLLTRLRSRDAAMELVQDVFVDAMAAPGSLLECDPPRRWLYAVARNKAADFSRRGAKGRDVAREWYLRRQDAAPGEPAEDLERLQSALFALPKEQCEIIRLHVYDGFTFREAAALLGEPAPTLVSRYHAGLRKLKDSLNG